jgi:hypothetical protein
MTAAQYNFVFSDLTSLSGEGVTPEQGMWSIKKQDLQERKELLEEAKVMSFKCLLN